MKSWFSLLGAQHFLLLQQCCGLSILSFDMFAIRCYLSMDQFLLLTELVRRWRFCQNLAPKCYESIWYNGIHGSYLDEKFWCVLHSTKESIQRNIKVIAKTILLLLYTQHILIRSVQSSHQTCFKWEMLCLIFQVWTIYMIY